MGFVTFQFFYFFVLPIVFHLCIANLRKFFFVSHKNKKGSKRLSHEADLGGLAIRIPFPFQKSIKVTFVAPETGVFWYVMHGIYELKK